MSNSYQPVTLKRGELLKILGAFDTTSELIHFGLELDSINGDQILWVDNGKFGTKREYIVINKPWKMEDE